MSNVEPTTSAHEVSPEQPGILKRFRAPVLFLAVGVTSFGIDTGLLLLLAGPAHVPTWLAASIAFWCSTFGNFFLNRRVFGRRQSGGLLAHSARYGTLLGVNYVITVLGLALAENAGIHLFPAKTALVLAAAVWNFFLYRHWVYR